MNKSKKESSLKKTTVPKLYRSEENRIIGGVAGGLGEYLDIDPVFIRIIFILLIFNGLGFLFYLFLWLIIPAKSKIKKNPEEIFRENVAEMKGKTKSLAGDLKAKSAKENFRIWLGIIIIVIGVILFLENLGIFSSLMLDRLWPLSLVVLGIILLIRKEE